MAKLRPCLGHESDDPVTEVLTKPTLLMIVTSAASFRLGHCAQWGGNSPAPGSNAHTFGTLLPPQARSAIVCARACMSISWNGCQRRTAPATTASMSACSHGMRGTPVWRADATDLREPRYTRDLQYPRRGNTRAGAFDDRPYRSQTIQSCLRGIDLSQFRFISPG
jgi:hypothetical protein